MLYILNEKKLTTKERNSLDSKQFGLPSKRKFPLTDEDHIRMAIKYFKSCDPINRNELAKNINKRAKELNMKIKVGKDNPFHKYAAPAIVKESDTSTYFEEEIINLPKGYNKLQNHLNHLMNIKVYDKKDLLSLEEYIRNNHMLDDGIKAGDESYYIIEKINRIMDLQYKNFLEYKNYEDNSNEYLFYRLINDVCISIIFKKYGDFGHIENELKILGEILENTKCNYYYIYRKVFECMWQYNIASDEFHKSGKNVTFTNKNAEKLSEILDITIYRSNRNINNDIKTENIFDIVLQNINHINFLNITDYLKTAKIEIEKQLYIITSSINFPTKQFLQPYIYSDILPNQLGNKGPQINNSVYSTISYLNNILRPENIKRLFKNKMMTDLSSIHLLMLTKCKKYIRNIFTGKDCYSDNLYFGIKDENIYLITFMNYTANSRPVRVIMRGPIRTIRMNTVQRMSFMCRRRRAGTICVGALSLLQSAKMLTTLWTL
jgi:hypothetical protein